MPKERYIRYYIGSKPTDKLVSLLSRAEIANHIKYDHGVIYTVNRPPPDRTRHKTRQKNTPIVPVANQPPVQHHLQQSVHQRPNPPVKLESKPLVRLESKSPVRLESKPLVRLEPKPIFKCIGCGKELQPLYGQEPGIMCGECFHNS